MAEVEFGTNTTATCVRDGGRDGVQVEDEQHGAHKRGPSTMTTGWHTKTGKAGWAENRSGEERS